MKVIELLIKDENETGVFAVSLVEKPAIQKLFVKFADETEKVSVKFSVDNEKHVITGPFMIPNLRMYRSAGSIGIDEESYVYFSEESILTASRLFLAQNFTNSVTLQHESATKGLTLAQSWIIDDPAHDKAALYGFSDLPKGTWMGSFVVNDEEIWSKIEDGTYAGFSIEAFFIPRIVEDSSVEENFSEEFLKLILEWVEMNKSEV
jgi:hypothetical protein